MNRFNQLVAASFAAATFATGCSSPESNVSQPTSVPSLEAPVTPPLATVETLSPSPSAIAALANTVCQFTLEGEFFSQANVAVVKDLTPQDDKPARVTLAHDSDSITLTEGVHDLGDYQTVGSKRWNTGQSNNRAWRNWVLGGEVSPGAVVVLYNDDNNPNGRPLPAGPSITLTC